MLARCLLEHFPSDHLLFTELRRGSMPMHRALDAASLHQLAGLQISLPSAHIAIQPDDPRAALVESVLAEEGLEVGQLKLRGLRRMFFSKGERAALFIPSNLEYQANPDEKHQSRQKLVLNFDLPPGSYATLLVKRILAPAPLKAKNQLSGNDESKAD